MLVGHDQIARSLVLVLFNSDYSTGLVLEQRIINYMNMC